MRKIIFFHWKDQFELQLMTDFFIIWYKKNLQKKLKFPEVYLSVRIGVG